MTTLATDYFGFPYDVTMAPAFIELSDKLVLHRATKKMYDYPALKATMAAASYTPAAGEIGNDDAWLMAHMHMGASTATPAAGTTPGGTTPTGAPITAAAAMAAKTVTLAGGPSDKAATLTVVYAVTGGADVTVTQAIAKGATAAATAAAIAAKITAGASAAAAGGVITITPTAPATTLSKLTATVA